MTGSCRVLAVCRNDVYRERIEPALGDVASVTVTGGDPEGRPRGTGPGERDAGYDCVLGVPDGDPSGMLACLREARDVPVVLFVGGSADAASLLDGGAAAVVRRDADGSHAILANRVRGVTAGRGVSGRPVADARASKQQGADAGRTGQPVADGGASSTVGDVDEPLERISDGFLAVDGEWRVTYLNGQAATLLSTDPAALRNETLTEALPGFAGSRFHEVCQEAMASGTETAFEERYEPLGVWLAGTAYPSADGLSVIFRNVTEQKRMRREREQREATLERLNGIASDPSLSREAKIERLLAAGADRLGVSHGFLTRIEGDTQEIVSSVGEDPALQPGERAPLSEAYCRHTLREGEPLAVSDAVAEGWEDDPAYDRFGLGCYLGVPIHVDGEQYGTVCFADPDPRESTFAPRDETFLELLADWLRHLLEQQAYERELEGQRAFIESLMDSLPDPLYALDGTGDVLRWNDRLEEVTGYSSEEIGSMKALEFVAPADRERVDEAMAGVWEGEHRSVEAAIRTSDGEEIPYELSGGQLHDEDGSVVGVAGVGRDITEHKAHRERLSNLLETTRSLMQARDREHVAELATNAARNLLGFESSTVRLYDGDAGTLVPAAATGPSLADLPVYDVGDGPPGEVFASGERQSHAPATDADETELGAVGAATYYPVGVHGTIAVGVTDPDGFDETDEQVLALLATSAAAACMRAKREQEVREAREHTERVLDRVNGLLQHTVEVLVQATTREELEEGVVAELAATDPYGFAWIGQPDLASETLSPTAWAGDAALPIEGHSFSLAGDDPVSVAYREGEPQVVEDLGAHQRGPWPEITAGADVGSLLIVPLVYKDATYGVLAVAAEAEALDEREQVVLGAIGRTVANAINAVERGRILDATEIIELEFSVGDADLLFNRLSAGAGCRIESAGIDYRSDGDVRLYLTATSADTADLCSLAAEDDDVREATLIADYEEECLLELIVRESLFATLTEYGAVPQAAVAENGTTEVTVELPYEAEARELFELVEDRYPGTDLFGYHERERAVETRQDFKSSLGDRLTDRQETALRTAYLGGFFDWPREVDGNDLAEAMDISRPTYHQHLRAAQAKVFEELFE
jgi:PAS domain S-box-containing protein